MSGLGFRARLVDRYGVIVNPKVLDTGLRTIGAGVPYTLRLRIEAMGFPTCGLLL